MIVAFYAPYSCNLRLFETELDLMQQEIDNGNDVLFLSCGALYPICEPNPEHEFEMCIQCCSRKKVGLNLLSKKPIERKVFNGIRRKDRKEFNLLKRVFKSSEELKEYKFDDYNIGFGVLSSLIDYTDDPEPDTIVFEKKIDDFISAAYFTHRAVLNFADDYKFKKLYVFNGRHAFENAAIKAATKRSIDYFTYEFGHDKKHYELNHNALPHDREPKRKEICRIWQSSSENTLSKVYKAKKYYQDNIKGKEVSYINYSKNQKKGKLPASWKKTDRNICIFNSSEREWAVTSDCRVNWFYPNQRDGIIKIINDLSQISQNLAVYLRMHPNMIGSDEAYLKNLFKLENEHSFFHIIRAESDICSYTLIKSANTVVTFGSTLGIEAVYLGTPSVLAAEMYYDHLDCTYNPSSHEELIKMIIKDLKPKRKLGAYMLGYYLMNYGLPYKYYKATELFSGKFKHAKVIHENYIDKIMLYNLHRKKIRLIYNLIVYLFKLRSNLYKLIIFR